MYDLDYTSQLYVDWDAEYGDAICIICGWFFRL